MNRTKKLLLALLMTLVVLTLFVASACEQVHPTHTFGEWEITTQPTETTGGVATHTCDCSVTENVDIPALSDSTVWTLDEDVAATHLAPGSKTYSSEYGNVVITIPTITEHSFSNWAVTTAPTADVVGEATRSCACGEDETQELPVLTDTEFWTLVTVPSTHTVAGSETYTSDYVTVVIDLKLLPHTYSGWTITTDPTEDATGTATRTCTEVDCDYVDTVVLAVLTDTTVWDLSEEIAATHSTGGSKTYTSDYGTVTVTVAIISHTYSEWTVTKEPTGDVTGTATRTCDCGENETRELPVLTNNEFWTLVTVPSTHTVAGTETYTSAYVTVVIDLKTIPHTYGAWSVQTKPTNEATGTATRTCTEEECAHVESVALPVLSNNEFWDVSTALATCQAIGSINYYSSEYDVTVVVTTPKLNHTFGNWTITTEPTTENTGIAQRVCTSCTTETETSSIANLSDDLVWNATITTPATCTTEGECTYTSEYGTVNGTLAKTPHTYGVWSIITEPNETTTGAATSTCTECSHEGNVVLAVLTDAEFWSLEEVPATHSTAGSKTYTSVYGIVTVTIDIISHTYSQWTITKEPTEDATGTATRNCNGCDAVEDAILPKLSDDIVWSFDEINSTATHDNPGTLIYTSIYGTVTLQDQTLGDHIFGSWGIITQPTTDQQGLAQSACSCGETKDFILPVLTDKDFWTLTTTPSTCTVAGNMTYASRYGNVVIPLELLEHTYGGWSITTDPTQENTGIATRYCTVCQTPDTTDVPNLADESWQVETIDSTCSAEGSTTYTSSVYGTVVVVIVMKPHTFATVLFKDDPDSHYYKCAFCDAKDAEAAHSYSEWDTITEATCEAEGEQTHICTACSRTENEPIAKLPHAHVSETKRITQEPTLENDGVAGYLCSSCDEIVDLVTVPNLQSAIWVAVTTDPTYNERGFTTYTSTEYGTVTIYTDKLVAPYDNKTYGAFELDASDPDEKNAVVSAYARNFEAAFVAIGANSIGIATAVPFRGQVTMRVLDATTGKISITTVAPETDTEGNTTYTGASSTVEGYIDWNTGLIIINVSCYDVELYTPFETAGNMSTARVMASTWDNAMAIEYTVNNETYKIFVYGDSVYFGVSFLDKSDEAVNGKNCYNSEFLYVYDNENTLIEGFVFNGTKLVIADGYEGTYANNELGSITLNGCGGLLDGTYTIVDGQDYTLEAFISSAYYEVTLDTENMTYTANKCMVSVVYNVNNEAVTEVIGEEYKTVNKNVAFTLPTLADTSTKKFMGWFIDEALQTAAGVSVTPTEDVTNYYAKWGDLVNINVIDAFDGNKSIQYGAGETIGSKLPPYTEATIDETNIKYFIGWELDDGTPLELSTELTVADEGCTVVAIWADIPVYAGSYSGINVFDASAGTSSSGKKNLTISHTGAITGQYTGTITDYNTITGIITWTNSSLETKYFWFEPATLSLVIHYNTSSKQDLHTSDDYYFFVMNESTPVVLNYAINYPCKDETSNANLRTRFVLINSGDKQRIVLIYDNKLYGDVKLTNGLGKTIAVNEIKDAKTIIAMDSNDNKILAVASPSTFSASTKTALLDQYYGTYTLGIDTLILDGGCIKDTTNSYTYGNVLFGTDKYGTYTIAPEGSQHTLEVYYANEFYHYTLDTENKTVTALMPTVTLSYISDHGLTHDPDVANMNVEFTLPTFTYEGFVFKGWKVSGNETVYTVYTPTVNVTFTAVWNPIVAVTLIKGNGEEQVVLEHEATTVPQLPTPTYTNHIFLGWYNTDETAYNNTPISEATTLTAKWLPTPPYVGSYTGGEVWSSSGNGNTSPKKTLSINESFEMTNNFSRTGIIDYTSYNSETHTLTYSSSKYMIAYYKFGNDEFILVNYSPSKIDPINGTDYYIMYKTATECSAITQVVWNDGKERVVQMTFGETTKLVYINAETNEFYANITMTNLVGTALTVAELYSSDSYAESLVIRDSATNLIAEYGKKNNTLVKLDGYHGTYANGDNSLVINGIGELTINDATMSLTDAKGTYTASAAANTFDVYVTVNEVRSYYVLVLNKTDMTYTLTYPTVDLTFTSDKDSAVAQTVNINIEVTLPVLTYEGFVFKGWKVSGDETVYTVYTPTVNVTFTAVWNPVVAVTLIKGNGEGPEVLDHEATTVPELPTPTYENHIFLGWNNADGTAYNNTPISEATTLTAQWLPTPPYVGSYTGANVRGNTGNGYNYDSKTLSINESFEMTNNFNRTGIIDYTSYNSETHTLTYSSNKYMIAYYKFGNDEFMLINSSTSKTDPINGTDYYVMYKTATACSAATQVIWNSGKERVVQLTFGETTKLFYINADTNEFYANITITKRDGTALTVGTLYAGTTYAESLVIYNDTNEMVKEYTNKTNVLIELDGYQGTYQGTLDSITLDGTGILTIGNTTLAYSLEGNTIVYVNENKQITLTLDNSEKSYVVALDGYQGVYTHPDGSNVTIDGYGVVTLANQTGVYYVKGTSIIITIDGTTTSYGIDTDDMALEYKSVFAGYTFTGTFYSVWDEGNSSLVVTFDDSPTLGGTMQVGNNTNTFTFTATFEGNTLVMTVTGWKYQESDVRGRTITATLSGNVFTITAMTFTTDVYSFTNNGSFSCADLPV